jgi:hypothetical protein
VGNLSFNAADGAAITIAADDVLLDLQGFTIDGSAAGDATQASGIYSFNQSGVKVRNGTITGFYRGVWLRDSSPGVSNSSGNSSVGLRLSNNTGVALGVEGRGSIVRDNLVVDTAAVGVDASASGISVRGALSRILNNDVVGVTATGSGSATGITLTSADQSIVERNRVGNWTAGANQTAVAIDSSNDVLAVQNRLHHMNFGLVFSGSTGKYRGHLSTGIAVPYPPPESGATNAGNNN